jgi:hypothetical protein
VHWWLLVHSGPEHVVGGGAHRFFLACSPDVRNVVPRVFPIGTESCRCRIIEGKFCYTECFGFLETRTCVKINWFSKMDKMPEKCAA